MYYTIFDYQPLFSYGCAYPYPIRVCFVCDHLITLPNHARKNNMIWTNENTLDLSSLCIEKTESGISPNLSMGITCATSESINSIIRDMWLYSD
jgi:hypothetical protein